VAIVPTAPERVRNRDAHYPYRFDSYFYYLTGFTEPEAVLVIVADANGEAEKHILFCRDKDPEQEIWNGEPYVQLSVADFREVEGAEGVDGPSRP